MHPTPRVLLRRLVVVAALCLVVPAAASGPGAASAAPIANAPSAAQARAGEWWLSEMGIEKAWSVTKGRGVVVGLVDSGVDATHPDLRDALTPGKDFSGTGAANGERPVGDDPTHGTAMAGYIAGRGHDRVGLLGSAPEATVMSASTDSSPDQDEAALRWLVDHGAKVINVSSVGTTPDAKDIAYAEAHDVVVVAGSGNGGTLQNPAQLFGVVAVSGVLKGGTRLASGATTGGASITLPNPQFEGSTAGVGVAGPFSTTDGNDDLVGLTTVAQGSYKSSRGTSNATAIVSGIVALIRAAHPRMDAANVINLLIRTASLFKQGRVSDQIGFGVPDAYAAVTATSATVATVCENPLGSEATRSLGIWPRTLDSTIVYKPTCATGGASSSPATSGASSEPASGSSRPSGAVASSDAALPASTSASGGSSGGVPVWVIVLIAVVVIGAAVSAFALRARGRRGGPPPGWQPS